VGGRQWDAARVGAGQGAAFEDLDDLAAVVEHASLDAPGQQRALEGAAVAAVADVEGAGQVA
jgi:hypothetical protein